MSNKNNDEILNQYGENGICLYEYPVIGGIKQYVQVRGENKKNPVLLFLHGGPGGSVAGLCNALQAGWEKSYTVVNWDQRNSCKTLLANRNSAAEIAKTGSVADYMKDIDELISYLHTKLDFDKLILVGFSWGSLIGAEYAKRCPDNVSYYIGVGQHVNYHEGLKVSCEWIKGLAQNSPGDTKKLYAFMDASIGVKEMDKGFMKQLRKFSMLGAKYIAKDARKFPVKEFKTTPFLNGKEKMAMIKTDPKLLAGSYRTLLSHDFRANMHFDMPVLFITGDEDFICPSKLLERCFEDIEAPVKKMVTIKKATHTCFYDQPGEFLRVVGEFVG